MVDDNLIKGDIVFNAKPDAVPYNYRISYKVSQLCLIMRLCGWGDTCSLIKLQMISYALFSKETMNRLIDYTDGRSPAPIVRFDPAVNKALTYAIAYGFVSQQKSGNYKLTTKGHNLAEQIKSAGDLMVAELACLKELSKKLTEVKIKELTELWRVNNASN